MIRRKVLILAAVLFLSSASSFAQAGDPALKEKAFDLLESLSTQIGALQSAENRARIGSNIAWSLWPHDEKRARAILIAVGQDINLGLQPPERTDPQGQTTFMVFLQLRADTIDRIAKYDPEFAFDFLKTTQPSYEQLPPRAGEKERAMTLRLAKQVADTNPEIALKLGRAALALATADDFLTLLRPLLRNHREQGVILYKETVDKLRKGKLTDDYRLLQFARSLAKISPPLADESSFRELIDFLFSVSVANKCDQKAWESGLGYICMELGPVLAQMGRVDPVRAAKLKHLGPQFEGGQGDGHWWSEVYAELDELVEARDFDGLMRQAEKYPPIKNTVYWRAFELARNDGDLERAQKIAASYNDNPEEKRRMLLQIERAKDTAVLSEAELEKIDRQAEEFTDIGRRFDYLIDTAIRVGANNRAMSLKLLDRATESIEGLKSPGVRTRALAGVAALYCMEKSDRGFTMMESLMPRLNELVDAAIKLDSFDTHYVRDGEWNMSANGELGEILTAISRNAPYFAWCDFDRALSIASQFDRAEIRMMAQLKLAQAIVAGPPKRMRD
ncbi:MAG TPA: hypothetical protein VFI24_19245 [Pyrinomonadaceae bacterium]|nr:hypothetical protein [Pyrinomonadaceae bacterium]